MQGYPDRLLPRAGYAEIEPEVLAEERGLCFVRHYEGDEPKFIAEGSTTLDPSCIKIPSGRLDDLSNNLLGVFKPSDVDYGIVKGVENPDWHTGDGAVSPPAEGEYFKKQRFAYYIPVDSVLKEFPDNLADNSGAKYHFVVLHTPVKYNFWHISIRVFTADGIHVQSLSRSAAKRINSKVRDYLIANIISNTLPPYNTLPSAFYTRAVRS